MRRKKNERAIAIMIVLAAIVVQILVFVGMVALIVLVVKAVW